MTENPFGIRCPPATRVKYRNTLLKNPFMGGTPAALQNALRDALDALDQRDDIIEALHNALDDGTLPTGTDALLALIGEK